uniref:Uncharacterized protein n=1 Tax=Arundo donax TaxID=35708 RepID=A0A0A9G7J6_ARUDO
MTTTRRRRWPLPWTRTAATTSACTSSR